MARNLCFFYVVLPSVAHTTLTARCIKQLLVTDLSYADHVERRTLRIDSIPETRSGIRDKPPNESVPIHSLLFVKSIASITSDDSKPDSLKPFCTSSIVSNLSRMASNFWVAALDF
jgi:hypothetical protein